MMLLEIVKQLHNTGMTMIVRQADEQVYSFGDDSVKTLFVMLTETPSRLRGAWIADRVVGMGDAALMVAGGVSRVHALVISERAMSYLHEGGVNVTAETCVETIFNSDGVSTVSLENKLASLHDLPSLLAAIDASLHGE